ncbi:MAG: DUF3168 domain-containing protein [Pyrinomonadaceae bacterium]
MALETIYTEKWLYDLFAGDDELFALIGNRFYAYRAPQGTVYPFVVYSFAGGYDVNTLNQTRVMARLLYTVKVIQRGARDAITRTAVNRVDELVGYQRHSVDAGYVFNSWREAIVSFDEIDARDSQRYEHIGGIYRIEAWPEG